jgi:hypothetical protein
MSMLFLFFRKRHRFFHAKAIDSFRVDGYGPISLGDFIIEHMFFSKLSDTNPDFGTVARS